MINHGFTKSLVSVDYGIWPKKHAKGESYLPASSRHCFRAKCRNFRPNRKECRHRSEVDRQRRNRRSMRRETATFIARAHVATSDRTGGNVAGGAKSDCHEGPMRHANRRKLLHASELLWLLSIKCRYFQSIGRKNRWRERSRSRVERLRRSRSRPEMKSRTSASELRSFLWIQNIGLSIRQEGKVVEGAEKCRRFCGLCVLKSEP